MYIAAGQGQTTPGDKILMSTEPLVTSVICYKFKKISLKSDFIKKNSWSYTCIQPRGRGWQPLGDEILMSPGTSCQFGHLLQVLKKISLRSDFIPFFSYFIHVYSCRSGADNPKRQNFDVNRNLLSLCSVATNLKKISLRSDFIPFFSYFIHVYSCRSGTDNPRRQNFDVNRNLLSLCSVATNFKKISLKSDFIQFFFSWFYTCI